MTGRELLIDKAVDASDQWLYRCCARRDMRWNGSRNWNTWR
jgi:hypothetical protein